MLKKNPEFEILIEGHTEIALAHDLIDNVKHRVAQVLRIHQHTLQLGRNGIPTNVIPCGLQEHPVPRGLSGAPPSPLYVLEMAEDP